MYQNKSKEFTIESGNIWFVYKDFKNKLIVGSMPEYKRKGIKTSDNIEDALDLPPKVKHFGESIRYRSKTGQEIIRSTSLIDNALERAGWQCEYSGIKTGSFVSVRTGQTYLEGHHLILLGCQSLFVENPLDRLENLFVLKPLWHRAIHYGVKKIKSEIVTSLYKQRTEVSDRFGVKKNKFLGIYICI